MKEKIKIFFATHTKTRRTVKFLLWFFGLLVGLIVLTFGSLEIKCRPNQIEAKHSTYNSPVPFEHQRQEVTTYLRYPEWFIVYSSDEYANFLQEHRPSAFPYFSSIGQYWGNYCQAYATTKARDEFVFGDHLMLFVIGWSYSAELAIKGVYENTIGRVTEWFGQYPGTEEDLYADQVAKDYVEFIRLRPWYEYNFAGALGKLWTENNFFGKNFVRKFERRMFLSAEYGVKTVYGWLIGIGSHSVYGLEDIETYTVLENAPEKIFADPSQIKKVKELGNGLVLVSIPRYQPFTDISPSLARQKVIFQDIAGNKEIFITVLVPKAFVFKPQTGRLLFEDEILTNPNKKRIGIGLQVESLSKVILEIESAGGSLEHIYDY